MKKGQVSIFVIIGLLLVIVVGAGLFISSSQNQPARTENPSVIFAAADRNTVESYVEQCMKQGFISGLEVYGLPAKNSNFNNHVLTGTVECINQFKVFKDAGFDITLSPPVVRMEDSGDTITYTLQYPVILTKGEIEYNLENFFYEFGKTSSSTLFEYGRATQDIMLESADRKSRLMIPAGTEVITKEGKPVTYVSLKILDKDKAGKNTFVIGNLIYEGLPDGATFYPPEGKKVTFTYIYRDEDLKNVLPVDMKEEDLSCAYSDTNLWQPWEESDSQIDTVNNILTCNINHFSQQSISWGCNGLSTSVTKNIDATIFRQVCALKGDPDYEAYKKLEFVDCLAAGHCNKKFKDVANTDSPRNLAVFMTKYNKDIMQVKDGFTAVASACELKDWAYKDEQKNICDCKIINEKGEIEPCDAKNQTECYESCNNQALASPEVSGGPINSEKGGDGIADDDDNIEVKVEGVTYKKGCTCVVDKRKTTELPPCVNVVPAPLTWGWEAVTKQPAGTKPSVDGQGIYQYELWGDNGACISRSSVSIRYSFDDAIYVKELKVGEKDKPDEGQMKPGVTELGVQDEDIAVFQEYFTGAAALATEKKTMTVDVTNKKSALPGFAFAKVHMYLEGSGIEMFNTPMDGACSVTLRDRLLFVCGCPSDMDLTKCGEAQACLADAMPASNTITADLDKSLCQGGIPESCASLVGDALDGGYCESTRKHCEADVDLSSAEACVCGSQSHTAGTKELCCQDGIVKSVPEGLPFECSSRTGVVNTCLQRNADDVTTEYICAPSCGEGYREISGDQYKCPIYSRSTGLIKEWAKCCERFDKCTLEEENGENTYMNLGQSLIRETSDGKKMCYYCDEFGDIISIEEDTPDHETYCPRSPLLMGDECKYATCSGEMQCCKKVGDTKAKCNLQADCQPGTTLTCGNGKIDGDEECDYLETPSNMVATKWGLSCMSKTNKGGQIKCNVDCTADTTDCTCGDGIMNGREECDKVDFKDDASCPLDSTSGEKLTGELKCTSQCKVDTGGCTCNNGKIDYEWFTPLEKCDLNNLNGNTCESVTKSEGSKRTGILECTENCDFDTTRCTCGNSDIDSSEGEECDDGSKNTNEEGCEIYLGSCKKCSMNCKAHEWVGPKCGDGKKDRGFKDASLTVINEECDDGNSVNNDGCSNDCKLENCGDGIKQSDEGCDDSNRNDNDGCSRECIKEFCGDGVKQSSEQCDDANTDDTDGCLINCKSAYCGDGVAWKGNEECDDANKINTDSCTSTCKKPKCGDGYIGPGEQCDGSNLNSKTCSAINSLTGKLSCSSSCSFDLSQCTCGNSAKSGWETCDGSDFGLLGGSKLCSDYSSDLGDGTLGCTTDCKSVVTAGNCEVIVECPEDTHITEMNYPHGCMCGGNPTAQTAGYCCKDLWWACQKDAKCGLIETC